MFAHSLSFLLFDFQLIYSRDTMVTTTNEDTFNEPILDIEFGSTQEISIPSRIIDQVIGQSEAVRVMRKAAAQGRHIMLIPYRING